MSIHIDATQQRERFINTLRATGSLHSPRWIDAFAHVPREQFVDQFAVPGNPGAGLVDYDLADDEDGTALEAVYTDHTLLTQWDGGGTAISSSSTPSLMARMLEHLDAHPGHRVLEIGTGTGYNAALLSHALGSEAVVSLDVDENLVDAATRRLRALGYTPHTLTGNGRVGAPDHAPFDRILATCGFDRVPAAWLDQLSEHAVVVINLGLGLAVLHGGPTGLCGPVVGTAAFMAARQIGDTALTARDVVQTVQALPNRVDHLAASLDPAEVRDPVVSALIRLQLPTLEVVPVYDEAGNTTYCLYDPAREARTRARLHGETATVTTQGPNLWDDLHAVVTSWTAAGRPELTRYGLTVHPDGSHDLWLDDPDKITSTLSAPG